MTGAVPVRIFVPRDAVAVGLGADRVVRMLATVAGELGQAIQVVRTGSRGLSWLEPMVEVETAEGRIAYGPVVPSDAGGPHPLRLGRPERIPYLAKQQRLTFARCGITDPLSLEDYRASGGLVGLERAASLQPVQVVDEVKRSGLRGRGGAGFPAGIKWSTVQLAQADRKYVVCNADEGDSGTFADRMLMEGDPFTLIEGMAIAGLATGAAKGFVYCRSEYPHAFRTLCAAVQAAERAGVLGPSVLGSGRPFGIEVRLGAGAYICGEETSLLESLEGKRGIVRAKPPIPAVKGLFGRPTLVNNVLTFAAVPWIMAHGGEAYAEYGMGRSLGTLPVQLAGNVRRGGLIELAFGVTLREIVEGFGGGTLSGRPVRAVQVGGPLGAYFPEHMLDLPLDYEALAAATGLRGHGGVGVFDDTVDLARQARFAFEFCAQESCGKCTPCRIGATRGVETLDKVIAGRDPARNLRLIQDLCEVMTDGSLCAMGGLTPVPVMSAITHFPEDFDRAVPRPVAAEKGERPGAAPRNRLRNTGPASGANRQPAGGRAGGVGAGGHLRHGRRHDGGHQDPEALRHRLPGAVRLLPDVPRGSGGTARHARLLHHPGGGGHGRTHAVGPAGPAAQGRDGAVHLRPPVGLPHLQRERRLRAAGRGRGGGAARGALRLRRREPRGAGIPEVPAQGRVEPVFHLRPLEVHRLQPLRPRLRGSAGHLRADDRGPRLRQPRLRRRHARRRP